MIRRHASTAGILAIVTVAAYIAYQAGPPRRMPEPVLARPVDQTMAAGMVALVQALTPTETMVPTATRTKTPKLTPEPTETPLPTYGAQLTPGLYEFYPPDPTKTPSYDVIDWPLCEELAASPTPMGFKRICEVKE